MSKIIESYKDYLEDVKDDNLHLSIDEQYEPLSFEEYVYSNICELKRYGFSVKNEFELNSILKEKEEINKIDEESLKVVKNIENLDYKLFGFIDMIKNGEIEYEDEVTVKEHLDSSKEILVKVYKLKVNVEKNILEKSSLKVKKGYKINVYKLSYEIDGDNREEYRFVTTLNKSNFKITSKNLIDTYYDGIKIIGDTETLMEVIDGECNIKAYLEAVQLFNEIKFIQIGAIYKYAINLKEMLGSHYRYPRIYKLNGKLIFRYMILDNSEIEDNIRVYIETVIFNKSNFDIKIFRDFTNLMFFRFQS